jgi:protein phosphatase
MIRSHYAPLHVAAVTHPGLGGRENEDRFSVSAYRVSSMDETSSAFAIISDGIGGHRAGEVAAEMAVETISHLVAQSDASRPVETLDHAIQAASDAIAAKARDDTQRLGMGTTCACAWVIGERLFIASVGDSRIYLLRSGSLMRLTTDHTWIQEAVDRGILRPGEGRDHPTVHVIRRYLGSPSAPQPDTRLRLAREETDTQARSNQGMRLLPGDLLLLCTDGLTDVVRDEEIEPAIRGLDLQAAAQALQSLALSRKAQDNLTVILMMMPWREGAQQNRKRRFWTLALGGLAGLCLVSVLIAAIGWGVLNYVLPPAVTPTPLP